tara:strand:- start:594 stop:971 length:378 start_codon:yes stop_codon:yes gene_type:complete
MCINKNSVKVLCLCFIALFIFTGQTNLESQMKELDRLQAQLEALQTGVKQEKLDIDSKNSDEEDKYEEGLYNYPRFQLVEFDYKHYNTRLDGVTKLKSIMKIDSHSGETWLFKVDGQEKFWEKIN